MEQNKQYNSYYEFTASSNKKYIQNVYYFLMENFFIFFVENSVQTDFIQNNKEFTVHLPHILYPILNIFGVQVIIIMSCIIVWKDLKLLGHSWSFFSTGFCVE